MSLNKETLEDSHNILASYRLPIFKYARRMALAILRFLLPEPRDIKSNPNNLYLYMKNL